MASSTTHRDGERATRYATRGIVFLLAIELIDELAFGATDAAWPLIKEDLGLSYAEIGILLGVPHLAGAILEPVLVLLIDSPWRRRLFLAGGVAFALALAGLAASWSFVALLVSLAIAAPASGVFLGVAQASLMEHEAGRREHAMARWAFVGSLGQLVGPLAIAAAIALGAGWRPVMLAISLLALLALFGARRATAGDHGETGELDLAASFVAALEAVRRWRVLRWLVMLQFSDLLLDVLYGYLALYFVDVAGASESSAGIAIAIWTAGGLGGEALLVWMSTRVDGLRSLRWSAVAAAVLFGLFLVTPGYWPKVALLVGVGLSTAGWYPILKARLYGELPGRGGIVLALDSLASGAGAIAPATIGLVAARAGLGVAMWLLLLGPLVILVGATSTSARGYGQDKDSCSRADR